MILKKPMILNLQLKDYFYQVIKEVTGDDLNNLIRHFPTLQADQNNCRFFLGQSTPGAFIVIWNTSAHTVEEFNCTTGQMFIDTSMDINDQYELIAELHETGWSMITEYMISDDAQI